MKKPKPKAKQRPAATICVTASVWRNQNERGSFYSVTYKESYRDAGGNWHDTDNVTGIGDTLELHKAADMATTRIIELQQQGARDTRFPCGLDPASAWFLLSSTYLLHNFRGSGPFPFAPALMVAFAIPASTCSYIFPETPMILDGDGCNRIVCNAGDICPASTRVKITPGIMR